MIWDCAIYNGEEQLLKICCEELKRLEPLKKMLPITHVLIESTHTFTGIEKPLTFKAGNWLDYAIEPFVFNEEPNADPWTNETRQRNYIKDALTILNAADDDIVIIRDVDEVPRAYAVQHYRPEFGLLAMQMDIHYFYLNALASKSNWEKARIMPWSYLKDRTPDEVRKGGYSLALVNAGWHMTYMGGVDAIIKKFASFSHQEKEVQQFARPFIINEKMNRLESLWNEDRLNLVPMTDLPLYVQQHQDEFKEMICSKTE